MLRIDCPVGHAGTRLGSTASSETLSPEDDPKSIPSASPASTAPFPFDSPRAEVILRSSDGVEIRFWKVVLAKVSPVFKIMFTLPTPQAVGSQHGRLGDSDPQIISMTEDTKAIRILLRVCEPVGADSSRALTVDEASILLEIARKYEMDGIEAHTIQALWGFVQSSPLRVYCLAVRHDLDKALICAAARAFLDMPILDHLEMIRDAPEMEHISAAAYCRLLDYRRVCCDAALKAIKEFPAADHEFATRCWSSCSSSKGPNTCRVIVRHHVGPGGDEFVVIKWFSSFIDHCQTIARETPSAKRIATDEVVVKCLADAWKCVHCAGYAWDDLHSYLPLLMAKIDEGIAQVTSCIPMKLTHP